VSQLTLSVVMSYWEPFNFKSMQLSAPWQINDVFLAAYTTICVQLLVSPQKISK
jgi:hypothetical protein